MFCFVFHNLVEKCYNTVNNLYYPVENPLLILSKTFSNTHKELINPPSLCFINLINLLILCKFSERIIRRAVCQVPRREILQDPHISRRDLINNGYGSRRDSHLTSRRDHHIIIKQTYTSRRDYHVLRRLRSRL